MKVVAVGDLTYPLYGGAQITIWTLLKRLHRESRYHCVLFAPHASAHQRMSEGVKLQTYRDPDELKALVHTARPDVMFTALDATVDALRVAQRFHIPTLTYFQDYEYYLPSTAEKRRWRIDMHRSYPSRAEVNFVLRTADSIAVNSRYLQACFERKYGMRARVLYPEFERESIPYAAKPQYIAGICGTAYKGAEIFLALADAFPHERFLAVGDIQPSYFAGFQQRPNIVLRGRDKPENFLSESKIVLVPSQWAEPFGRIAVEAMGAGIPTLVSGTGGLKETVGDAPGKIVKFRTVEAWHAALGDLVASEARRTEYGTRGRTAVARFLQGKSTRQLAQWMETLAARKTPCYDTPPTVALRGGYRAKSAYAVVNAAWRDALQANPGIQLRVVESEAALEFEPADVVIDHDFSRNFTALVAPRSGKWILVRPWDFGPYPPAWVAKINAECDQLWVHSQRVRAQAIAGGVDPRRVRVVQLGIDAQSFTPKGAHYRLPSKKRFKFLFVGAAVLRKGIDLLLQAYREAFTADDDVSLVIKDNAGDVFYRGITFRDEIAKLQADPRAPEIIYLNRYLSVTELSSLYRACDVSVFPYRAEGFGIPILEAMACGTPPIVPRFGACLDFCSDANAFLMPARRIALPVQGKFTFNTLGYDEELTEVDFCQVTVVTLAEYLRNAYTMPAEKLKRVAEAGVRRAHSRFTWEKSAAQFVREVQAVNKITTPHRLERVRAAGAAQQKKRAAAEELYRTFLAEPRRAGV